MTFCDTIAGNSISFRTHRRTDERTDGWTDKHGSRNSYLDKDFPLTVSQSSSPFQILSPWGVTSKASLRSKITFYTLNYVFHEASLCAQQAAHHKREITLLQRRSLRSIIAP